MPAVGLTAEDLATVPIFAALDAQQRAELILLLDERTAPPQSMLISEGERPAEALFVVLGGEVEIVKVGADGREHLIGQPSTPTVVGEVELLTGREAIAGVRSRTEVSYAALPRAALDELRARSGNLVNAMYAGIARILADRLAATDAALADTFEASYPDLYEQINMIRAALHAR